MALRRPAPEGLDLMGLFSFLAEVVYVVAALLGGADEPAPPVEGADPVVVIVEEAVEASDEVVVIVDPLAEGQTDTPAVIQGETVETHSDFYYCRQFPTDCVNGRWVPAPADPRIVVCTVLGSEPTPARSIADVDTLIASGECTVIG